MFIFFLQGIVHSCLFFFILRVVDVYKTEGDIREACGMGSTHSGSVANRDIIEDEDDDVKQERERVKNLSGANVSLISLS